MRKHHFKILYEGTMICLLIISLAAMMSNEESNMRYVHQIIWFIFLIDVSFRFIKAAVKWRYIKDNPFDIVTVIPLEDIMVLARFARFLRLFRYKNIVKRYVDGISIKVQEIGFLRLSLAVFSTNIIITLILYLSTSISLLESTIWVWGNFLKFNYETNIGGLVVLSIIIKIVGLIYLGIVISEVISVGRQIYERYRKNKQPDKTESEKRNHN